MILRRLLPLVTGALALFYSFTLQAHPIDDAFQECLAVAHGRAVFNRYFLNEVDSLEGPQRTVTVPITSYDDLLAFFRLPGHREEIKKDIQIYDEIIELLSAASKEADLEKKRNYADNLYISLVLRSDFPDQRAARKKVKNDLVVTLSEAPTFFSLAKMLRVHLSDQANVLCRNTTPYTDTTTGSTQRSFFGGGNKISQVDY